MMSRITGILLTLSFVGSLWIAPASAQYEATPAVEATVVTKPMNEFKAAKLEELRYRHLWIAYGAIWLIVFNFVFRTWRRGNSTASELDELKRRLAELEGRKNG